MSKIIKAFQLTQVKSFDFQEIETELEVSEELETQIETEDLPLDEPDPGEDPQRTIERQLEEAKRRAQQLEKEGYEQGYNQGLQDGYEAGREAMADTKERLEQLFQELQSIPRKVFQDYRNWFIETVLAVARQIVQNELSCRPELLIELMEALLGEAEKDHAMTLYLNPDDIDAIEQNVAKIGGSNNRAGALTVKAEPAMSRGGCRLESAMQLLDASIETRFSLIREILSGQKIQGENEPSH